MATLGGKGPPKRRAKPRQAQSSRAGSGRRKRRPNRSPGVEQRRLGLAVLISLVVHALLLSLTFGSQALGLPGLSFPWQERRAEALPLRIVLGLVLVPPPASASMPVATPASAAGQVVPLPLALPAPVMEPAPGWVAQVVEVDAVPVPAPVAEPVLAPLALPTLPTATPRTSGPRTEVPPPPSTEPELLAVSARAKRPSRCRRHRLH